MHGECQSPERTENVKHVLARNSELSLLVVAKYNSYLSKNIFFPCSKFATSTAPPFCPFSLFLIKNSFVMNRAEILLHFLDIRWQLMNVSIIQHLLSFVNENMKLGHLFYRNFCLTLLMRCLQATQTVAVR